jgi:hypothetical protein
LAKLIYLPMLSWHSSNSGDTSAYRMVDDG